MDVCRKVIEKMQHCPKLVKVPLQAFYDLETDTIHMPPPECFNSQSEYFAAFFKVLISSTKAWNRCDRTELAEFAMFDSESFANEELTCEVGAWYLRSYFWLQVKPSQYDEDYIPYWIERLKYNPWLAYMACDQAQRAVEFILGIKHDNGHDMDWFEDELLPF